MASIIKAKRLSLEFAKKNYPILYNTIEALNDAGLSDKQKEIVAGLCLEVALKANGTPSIFTEDEDELFIDEDEF